MEDRSVYHGWLVLFGPFFLERLNALHMEVKALAQRKTPAEFRAHPTVKLLASVVRLVTAIIPQDPDAAAYRLSGDLAKFRRVKKQGLPPRYRIFFAFSTRTKSIIFLYLNDESTIRKEGDKNDVYEAFRRMIRRGEIGEDFEANLHMIKAKDKPE